MRVLSLEIENILSIEKATITFENNGLVLVEGWNFDTNRANGAGKTALFNCLAFGLYDKLPRKITASEILRRGSKAGNVRCSVLCGEDIWTVQRSRPKGVEFSKNGIRQDIVQEEFESHIRLSYSQFLLTIYVPQANSGQSQRFLAAPDTGKKDFILQLLNLDTFRDAKTSIDGLIKSRQAGIDLEANKLNTVRSRIEVYEESLIDTASVEKAIIDSNSSLELIEKEILECSLVIKPDLSKYTKIEDGIRSKQSDIAQAKAKRSMLHDRYRELNAQVAEYDPDIACNECGSSLDKPEARVAHTSHQEKVKQKAIDIKNSIDDVDLVVSEEQAVTLLVHKLRDKKSKESEDYQTAQKRLIELNAFANKHKLLVENCNLKLIKDGELVSKIQGLKESVIKHIDVISSNKRELELYQALAAIYSPTGAQAYVLDSVVDSFNEVIQKYIDIMSPNMSYTLNSFKETAKGDIVAKFSEMLTKAGESVSVGSLSGGEEKGLSLCVDFALLEVLETQFGMSLNPIILDEPFDGLDAAGREIVIDLLENLARNRQIFVIDHSSITQSSFEKTVRIELRNNISVII